MSNSDQRRMWNLQDLKEIGRIKNRIEGIGTT
jgi:hypothetical protein